MIFTHRSLSLSLPPLCLSLWHDPTELAHSFLFCSCVYFCLYGPFHLYFIPSILPTTLRFLALLFQWYFCLIGPFSCISLMKLSFSPDLILCGWLDLECQLTNGGTDRRTPSCGTSRQTAGWKVVTWTSDRQTLGCETDWQSLAVRQTPGCETDRKQTAWCETDWYLAETG